VPAAGGAAGRRTGEWKIFDNATLRQILERLINKTHRVSKLFYPRRDFKNTSVTHLARICDGLP